MDTEPTPIQSTSPTKYPIPSVIQDLSQWPINKMYQDKENFMQDVLEFTKDRIIQQKKGGSLRDKLAAVLFSERARIIENPWKVDPPDEMDFWSDIRKRMFKGSFKAPEEGQGDDYNEELLKRILNRYIREITGNFKISTYKQARILLPMLFNTILNTITLRRGNLQDRLNITGSVEHLRSLVSKGTVVLVPTHFSNLDSILIGWAADRIGMLAFSYGAGLNLFNNKIMSYFFSRLGAYTLDRRKKNPFYLESLKSFSQLSIERGVHTLFFPGGTRSRAGSLESKVKLGLLGTAIDAQNRVFERKEENKIYIVPVVLNYHFVLEAKSLIEQHLKYTGKEQYMVEQHGFGGLSKVLKFLRQFISNSSEIIVNFGRPMDVMGNFVDMEGNSHDQWGRAVDLKDYFISQNEICYDRQRNEMYTTKLAKRIVERYRVENIVLSSQLVAFTAFNIIRKRFPDLDLYGVLRLPKEDRCISQELLYKNISMLRAVLKEMKADGKLQLSKIVDESTVEQIVSDGISKGGAFHVKKPLKLNKNGVFESQDLNLLYYYHNRLTGYDLSQVVNPHILLSNTK